MHCPSCGQNAPSEARFCVDSGVALNYATEPHSPSDLSTRGVTSSTLQPEYARKSERLAALVINLVVVLVLVSFGSYLVFSRILPVGDLTGAIALAFIPVVGLVAAVKLSAVLNDASPSIVCQFSNW